MNILWIEDFGGGLNSGQEVLTSMFGELLNFDDWDEDVLDIKDTPDHLETFCINQRSIHRIYLCRNYFDYEIFRKNNSILIDIDAVIIDIRLDNGQHINFDLPIPEPYLDKQKFHENAGFYIFNDLLYLGFPSEKICFMTGEKSTFADFQKKCTEIYLSNIIAFEKNDILGYPKLRDWIATTKSDYSELRRGVISGCNYLSRFIGNSVEKVQLIDFVKLEKNQLTVEIANEDLLYYLETMIQLLPITISNTKINMQFRLFLRTLSHEWEENIGPLNLKKRYGHDLSKIYDIYTFGWIMKIIRNWMSHANLLEPFDSKIVSFLFLVNMRAIFKLPKEIQEYEYILLNCITKNSIINIFDLVKLKSDIKYSEEKIDQIIHYLGISEFKENKDGGLFIDKNGNKINKTFGEKINDVYRRNKGNPDAESHNYKQFILQFFWINQKDYLNKITASVNSNHFLHELARCIYKDSFN